MTPSILATPRIKLYLGVGGDIDVLNNVTPDQAYRYSEGVFWGCCEAHTTDNVPGYLIWMSVNYHHSADLSFQLAMFTPDYAAYNCVLLYRLVINYGWASTWKYYNANSAGTVGPGIVY